MTTLWLLAFGMVIGVGFTTLFCLCAMQSAMGGSGRRKITDAVKRVPTGLRGGEEGERYRKMLRRFLISRPHTDQAR